MPVKRGFRCFKKENYERRNLNISYIISHKQNSCMAKQRRQHECLSKYFQHKFLLCFNASRQESNFEDNFAKYQTCQTLLTQFYYTFRVNIDINEKLIIGECKLSRITFVQLYSAVAISNSKLLYCWCIVWHISYLNLKSWIIFS